MKKKKGLYILLIMILLMSFNGKISQAKEYEIQINIIPGSKYEDLDDLSGISFYFFKIPDRKIIDSGMDKYEINDFLDEKSLEELKTRGYSLENISPPTNAKGKTTASISEMGYYYVFSESINEIQLAKPFTHFKLDGGDLNIPILNIKRTMNVFDLNVEKVWLDSDSQPIKVKLIPEGLQKLKREYTLSEENNWNYQIQDLPIKDTSGKKLAYWIVEDVPKGYEVEYILSSSHDESLRKQSLDSAIVIYPYNKVTIINEQVEKIDEPDEEPEDDGWEDKADSDIKTGDQGQLIYIASFIIAGYLLLLTDKRKKNEKRR